MAQVTAAEVVYTDDVKIFTDIAKDMEIRSIRHIDWQSTSETLANMGLSVENNKSVHA